MFPANIAQPVGAAPAAEPASTRGIWVKTHLWREGPRLRAKAYIVAGGQVEVLDASVDLRPIAQRIALYHEALHKSGHTDVGGCLRIGGECIGGCVGNDCIGWDPLKAIGRAATKLGKSKLLKGISRGVKSVIKSKVVGSLAVGASVVFPPVGAPALAAYTAANATLAAYENGKRVKDGVKRAGRALVTGKKTRAALAKAKVSTSFRINVQAKIRAMPPAARQRLKASLKQRLKAFKQGVKVKHALTQPATRAKIRTVLTKQRQAAQIVARVAETARYGENPAERKNAQKMGRILQVVAASRQRAAQAASQVPAEARSGETGLVITDRGEVVKGRFLRNLQASGAAPQLLLAASGSNVPGYYTKVSGCIGC